MYDAVLFAALLNPSSDNSSSRVEALLASKLLKFLSKNSYQPSARATVPEATSAIAHITERHIVLSQEREGKHEVDTLFQA